MIIEHIFEAFLFGVGLSMDALAASLASGASEGRNFTWKKILLTAFLFGFFQLFMPVLGFFGGSLGGDFVRSFGRIIACILLLIIGGKMIWERNKEEEHKTGLRDLLLLAIATSIDALLIGVGYACLGRTAERMLFDVIIIGCTTFLISAAGCIAGRMFGGLFQKHCAVIGGGVLILLGVKILIFG